MMHMADALISPAVGVAMWAAAAGLAAYSAHKLKSEMDERKVPLMGVLGAFVFTAQMINFAIPVTGSSGHIGGGLLLAILLGPYAAFLTLMSVLIIQALFFADGGILALGCNIINMAFWACFVAYPLIYRKMVGEKPTPGRILAGSTLAVVIGLQFGAFSVVLETVASGISELPFHAFVLLMQPIHLAIGLVEGLVTAALVTFVWNARPEILAFAAFQKPLSKLRLKPVLAGLLIAALVTGSALSWFSSPHPDGLEWSMAGVVGKEALAAPQNRIHSLLANLQEKTVVMPDYDFKKTAPADAAPTAISRVEAGKIGGESWPAINGGTSAAGALGGVLTLVLVGMIGIGLRFVRHRRQVCG